MKQTQNVFLSIVLSQDLWKNISAVFHPWHIAVDPCKFRLIYPLAKLVYLQVCLMVAKADVIYRGVVHDVHNSTSIVQAGEQAGGNKISCQDTYAICCPRGPIEINFGLLYCYVCHTICLTVPMTAMNLIQTLDLGLSAFLDVPEPRVYINIKFIVDTWYIEGSRGDNFQH